MKYVKTLMAIIILFFMVAGSSLALDNKAQNEAPEFEIQIDTVNPKVNSIVSFDVIFTKGDSTKYTYRWDFNADSGIDYSATGSSIASHKYTQAGNYLVKLTISGKIGTYKSEKNIIVAAATIPTVTIKASNEAPIVGEIVVFNTEFSEENPYDYSYSWDFNGDNTADSSKFKSASYSYSQAGTYTINLILTNLNTNYKRKITKQITVKELVVPEFTITVEPVQVKVGEAVKLTVVLTKGNVNDYTYFWDYTNDNNVDAFSVGTSISTMYNTAGTYNVKVTLATVDKKLYSATKQIIVTDVIVNPVVNTAPTADFTFLPVSPEVNKAVQFTATASDAQNDVLTYAWDFNKDNTVDSTLSNPSYTFTSIGSFEVALTVSDGKLQTVVKKTLTVVVVVPQTDKDKVKTVENKFNDYEDDYTELRNDYEDALKDKDKDEVDDIKDDLKKLYNNIKDLEYDINNLQDVITDNNLEDDLKDLEKDVKNLKKKVLDLKGGNFDTGILNPSSVSSAVSSQSSANNYVPQQTKQQEIPQKQIVEVFSTPSVPSASVQTPALNVDGTSSAVKVALIIAGVIILFALVIFMIAVIFKKF